MRKNVILDEDMLEDKRAQEILDKVLENDVHGAFQRAAKDWATHDLILICSVGDGRYLLGPREPVLAGMQKSLPEALLEQLRSAPPQMEGGYSHWLVVYSPEDSAYLTLRVSFMEVLGSA
jgi:hypothetical protein